MDAYSTGSFVYIFSMGKKHKYEVAGREHTPESPLADKKVKQTIWCCFRRYTLNLSRQLWCNESSKYCVYLRWTYNLVVSTQHPRHSSCNIILQCTCISIFGLGLWCSTWLSTVFELYLGSKFYCYSKPEYSVKTTDLSEYTCKLYHITLYRIHLAMWVNITTPSLQYKIINPITQCTAQT